MYRINLRKLRCTETATVRRNLGVVCRVHASLNGLNQSVVLMVSHTSRLATPDVTTYSETTLVTLP